MKRFIAILLVLCSFATPIYASADNSDYGIMPAYEAVSDYEHNFVISASGIASISFNYDLMNNAQSIRIETKIQKKFLFFFWSDIDGGSWTDSFTTSTGSFKHTLQLADKATYRAVFHVYAVGSDGSVDDFELTKEYVYD